MIIDKSSPIPQYFQLQTWLMEQIDQGVFKPNDQIPTEKELRQLTGLARATIRQAVGNLVNIGYLVRHRRLGTYVLDRKKEDRKRTIVGILIPDIRTGYAPELARGAEDEASRQRHSLILCNTDDSYVKADRHADRLIEAEVSGIIFIPTANSNEKNHLLIEKFTRRNIPVVLADRTIPDIAVDHVTTDNFQGALNLTTYLIEMGHRRIAIILNSFLSTERERLEGYQAALAKHDLTMDPEIVISEAGPFSKEHYREYIGSLLERRDKYTAIFAGHDRIAQLIYSAAQDLGLDIPGDISLVGYDDLPFTTFSLTTMLQPIYELGRESLKLILSRIRGENSEPQRIVLKSNLVERSSVKALK